MDKCRGHNTSCACVAVQPHMSKEQEEQSQISLQESFKYVQSLTQLEIWPQKLRNTVFGHNRAQQQCGEVTTHHISHVTYHTSHDIKSRHITSHHITSTHFAPPPLSFLSVHPHHHHSLARPCRQGLPPVVGQNCRELGHCTSPRLNPQP